MKAAVLKADWFDPEINPKLADFCRHYGMHVMPCRPSMPQHKGKIERGVAYLRTNALKGRRFKSLAEENLFLSYWENSIADQRIHGTTRKQVAA
jgi:transposase